MGMVRKDLKDYDHDLTWEKKEWRKKILELYWGEEKRGRKYNPRQANNERITVIIKFT